MDPRLQLLRNQAEYYLEKEYPEEYKRLKKTGQLEAVVNSRAQQAEIILEQCQAKGLGKAGTSELVEEALNPAPPNQEPEDESTTEDSTE